MFKKIFLGIENQFFIKLKNLTFYGKVNVIHAKLNLFILLSSF